MAQLFKHTYIRIYFFYQNVLQVKRNTHYYASFVLGLFLFSNIFFSISIFTLLIYKRAFDFLFPYYIGLGVCCCLLVIFIMGREERYLKIISEYRLIGRKEKRWLDTLSTLYMIFSAACVLSFMVYQNTIQFWCGEWSSILCGAVCV